MMTPRHLLSGLLLAGALTLAPSGQALTCDEYATYVKEVAVQRNKGVSHTEASARLWRFCAAMNTVRWLYAVQQDAINHVYAAPQRTPKAWHRQAYQACVDFLQAQPPRSPQLQPPGSRGRCTAYERNPMPEALHCDLCTAALNADELEAPYVVEGQTYCDACYYEEFQFTCSWCEEYGEVGDQQRYLVVYDAEAAGLALPGLYRFETTPYYTSGLIGGGWVHDWAVTWLGYLPNLREPDGYPVGHFCGACQAQALVEVQQATACGILAGQCLVEPGPCAEGHRD